MARSGPAKRTFQKAHPCPATGRTSGACPGYVIDHVVPLKRGGADAPGNMQWQTKAAAKAKDKAE
ncbi:MAG: HNH endonuclease [Acidobacteriota bacterium]|nr:HNH endonuclease [Acidobacteriota bacterium]